MNALGSNLLLGTLLGTMAVVATHLLLRRGQAALRMVRVRAVRQRQRRPVRRDH